MKLFKNLSRRDVAFAVISVFLVVVQVWLELTMPDYTQRLTSSASVGDITMKIVWENGTMMLLCALGSLVASCVCGFFSARIAASFAQTLRSKLFDKITGFSAAEFNTLTTPSLITRTTNDVVQMQLVIATGLQLLIRAPLMAIWAITKISNTGIEWTMATVVSVVIILVLVGSLILICYPRIKIVQKLTDDLNDVTRETISGVRVVRAFNAERYQEEKFDSVNGAMAKNSLFTGRVMGLMSPIMTVCMSGLTLAIYWIGAVLINRAALSDKALVMGNMVAFTQYAMQIVMSFMLLSAIFVILPRIMVSAKRINEVLDTVPAVSYPEKEAECTESGSIEFKNVSFSYHDSQNACLKGLNFKIAPGETFAIIGATGVGKTSLINLIPRFYDASAGEVLVDGVNVRSFPKKQLEDKISIATQRAILFSGDIKSNVVYGTGAEVADDDERFLRSLDIAQADFIEEFEGGIHYAVAQGGANLSGGQKQRISVARAVFKDAGIYIFDDTFSALDFRTDMLLRKALRRELSGKTVIIVAQRIGTIMNADRILVLADGEAVGLGTHEELMVSCPIYKEIALSQLSEEELK